MENSEDDDSAKKALLLARGPSFESMTSSNKSKCGFSKDNKVLRIGQSSEGGGLLNGIGFKYDEQFQQFFDEGVFVNDQLVKGWRIELQRGFITN